MSIRRIILGISAALLTLACTNDEMLGEKENIIFSSEVAGKSIENLGDRMLSKKQDIIKSSQPSNVKRPLCADIDEYFEVKVIFFNFSNNHLNRRFGDILRIRRRYESYFNLGECREIIIPFGFNSVDCQGETCSEIWYFYNKPPQIGEPEGGGTLPIDVEAPGP